MKHIESSRQVTIYTKVWLAGNEFPITVENTFTVAPPYIANDQIFTAVTNKVACIKKFGTTEFDLYTDHHNGWSRLMTLTLTIEQYKKCPVLDQYTVSEEILGQAKDDLLLHLLQTA